MNQNKVPGKVSSFLICFMIFSPLNFRISFRNWKFRNFRNIGLSIMGSIFKVQQFSFTLFTFSSINFRVVSYFFITNVLLWLYFYEIISVLMFSYVHTEYVWNDVYHRCFWLLFLDSRMLEFKLVSVCALFFVSLFLDF